MLQFLTWMMVALFVGQWAYKHIIKPRKARLQLKTWSNKPHIKRGLYIIHQLYKGIDGKQVSKAARRHTSADSSLVYGEIDFLGFAEILEIVNPKQGDVFYDLGSGAGRAVFAAVLLHNFKEAKGVELLRALYQLSCKQLDTFNQMPAVKKMFEHQSVKIQFILGDMLVTDLSDADVVFINATAFFGDLWANIVRKLETLKSGTKIILTSRQLNDETFRMIDNGQRLMSWGVATVYIYERR